MLTGPHSHGSKRRDRQGASEGAACQFARMLLYSPVLFGDILVHYTNSRFLITSFLIILQTFHHLC